MRQDTWLYRTLERHAFIAYHCHQCGEAYYSTILFASHLYADHGVKNGALVRFVGDDSDEAKPDRPNRSRRSAKAT